MLSTRTCKRLALAFGFLVAASSVSGAPPSGDANFTAITYENGADGSLLSPGQAFFDKASGELFVASPGNHRIIIYSADLTAKFSFPHFVTDQKTGESKIGEPKMVVVNSNGDMLIIDNLAEYLDVVDFRGKTLYRIYPNRLLLDSTLRIKSDLVAIDDHDNVYLAVTGDIQAILVLDRDLQLKRRILQAKSDPNVVNLPLSMAVYDSLLVISDLHGLPVMRVYDTLGQYLYGFGGRESDRSDFSLPVSIVVSRDSTGGIFFLVADALRQVVKLLGPDGQQIATIGGYGLGIGAMQYPSGLASDGKGTYFVVERVGARIQKFDLR